MEIINAEKEKTLDQTDITVNKSTLNRIYIMRRTLKNNLKKIYLLFWGWEAREDLEEDGERKLKKPLKSLTSKNENQCTENGIMKRNNLL